MFGGTDGVGYVLLIGYAGQIHIEHRVAARKSRETWILYQEVVAYVIPCPFIELRPLFHCLFVGVVPTVKSHIGWVRIKVIIPIRVPCEHLFAGHIIAEHLVQCRFIHASYTEQPPFSRGHFMPVGESSVHRVLFTHAEQHAVRIVLRCIDQHQICRFCGDRQRQVTVYMADVFALCHRRSHLRLIDPL